MEGLVAPGQAPSQSLIIYGTGPPYFLGTREGTVYRGCIGVDLQLGKLVSNSVDGSVPGDWRQQNLDRVRTGCGCPVSPLPSEGP